MCRGAKKSHKKGEGNCQSLGAGPITKKRFRKVKLKKKPKGSIVFPKTGKKRFVFPGKLERFLVVISGKWAAKNGNNLRKLGFPQKSGGKTP